MENVRRKSRRAATLAKHFTQFPLHSSHAAAKRARNDYNDLIVKSKRQHWDNWLENISAKTVWDAHKFTSAPASDGSKTRIPKLRTKNIDGSFTEILDNQGKSKALHEVFFYQPPVNFGVDPKFQYPEPTIEFEEVTNEQIARVAKSLNPFRATFNANYYPQRWKKYKTIVLRKPVQYPQRLQTYRPTGCLCQATLSLYQVTMGTSRGATQPVTQEPIWGTQRAYGDRCHTFTGGFYKTCVET